MAFLRAIRRSPRIIAQPLRAALLCLAIARAASLNAQDQFVFYFDGAETLVGTAGGFTFDAAGNFWAIGRNGNVSPFPAPRITKMVRSGNTFTAEPYVTDEDLAFFYRSADLAAGTTNPTWGGPQFGTPASFLLNPAPLTITVPTGSGGTMQKTYQPGELAFVTDAQGVLSQGTTPRYDATKKVWRYDLRKVDNPDGGISGPTTSIPDFANAKNHDGTNPGGTTFGSFGKTDWNDAFAVVMSEANLNAAVSPSYPGGSDNFGRSFAWSSNGQRIYAIDAGANSGGIYRIEAAQSGVVTRVRQDTTSNASGDRIVSEPAVVATSVRDFDPANSGVGDQIIVEGSADGGNNGGVNVYLDTGAATLGAPKFLFTEADFRNFAEYYGGSAPQYTSFAADSSGNLYFSESRTDGLYLYDGQGRLAKLASEAEHNAFQTSRSVSPTNDTLLDFQVRSSTAPGGFSVKEVIYTDDGFEAPVGVLAYKIGDFNRDNNVDGSDLSLFRIALGVRGAPAAPANFKFDLNGNAQAAFNPTTMLYEQIADAPTVVDWKDVKILQQFVPSLRTGDANFDGLIDFSDLDLMSANYYTVPGQDAETWATGDFASVDPLYAVNAPDAKLVNLVDLQAIAGTWLNVLGQPPVTEGQATGRGYSGQFLTDLVSVFSSGIVLDADFNNDGSVNGLDLQIWKTGFGGVATSATGDANGDGTADGADLLVWQRQAATAGFLAADFNHDASVNAADLQIWKAAFGGVAASATGDASGDGFADGVDLLLWQRQAGTAPLSAVAAAVPEPATPLTLAFAAALLASGRRRHVVARL